MLRRENMQLENIDIQSQHMNLNLQKTTTSRREKRQLENIDIQSQHMNLLNAATEFCILGDQIHILCVLLRERNYYMTIVTF